MRKLGPGHVLYVPAKFAEVGGYQGQFQAFLSALSKETGGYTLTHATGGWIPRIGAEVVQEQIVIVTTYPPLFDYVAYGRASGVMTKFADWMIDQGEREVMLENREGVFLRNAASRYPAPKGIRP